uniref:Cupin type-1 domain-containing protein n=1 Tax=Solanum bulbocastanum TaxID=147425 RepID=A9XLG8_SOLBU|nr:unknown [Solanum bulbocastanum]
MSVKNCFSIQCCKMLFKFLLFMIIISYVSVDVRAKRENEGWEWGLDPLVKRAERKTIISTENGQVSSVTIADGTTGSYHLQFITLEPNSLFLPVVLHSDMVFYVHTGSGKLTWMHENEEKSVDLRIGDVFRLPFGSIFFLESNLDPIRQKLRVYSIFPNSGDDFRESLNGPYSSIRKMVLGFDKKVLQAAFHVPEDVIEQVLAGTEVPAIVHGVPKSTKKKNNLWEMEAQFMKTVLRRGSYSFFDNQKNKKKSSKLFNVFQEKPDFENCNGWSTVIDRKKLPALKGSQIGIYVVNLTKGSMMGPHWNPMATEIGIAIQGEGMVRVVCSNSGTGQGCKNMRFKMEEGDVFVVPRFHPMAQMAFNNNSFVFVGFSTTTKKHHPQYLTGRASVLQTLDRHILEASFNVANTTMHQILEAQGDSVILECTSCAEEEKRLMEEERRREEEEAKKKEEEERRKEEEEARKAEEERREKEAEEARKREEEEERKRQEEEAKRQEEEIRRRQEEEEARKRQEEEERERQEARKRQEEKEEEAAQREAEQARREEEEAEKRRHEEEEARRQEEEKEEARRRQQEEETEEARRREEEEAVKRKQEEEAQREEEAETRRKQEEEEARRQEEEKEEARRRQQEEETTEEARRREEEEARRREEEAETTRKQEEEESWRREEEEEESRSSEEDAESERQEVAERQEEARRQEEETEKRHQQETEEDEPGRHERILLKVAMSTYHHHN